VRGAMGHRGKDGVLFMPQVVGGPREASLPAGLGP
jgi:hypothetical protein